MAESTAATMPMINKVLRHLNKNSATLNESAKSFVAVSGIIFHGICWHAKIEKSA
jgi:hypothetical protein